MSRQRTIALPFSRAGRGLRSGVRAAVHVEPADDGVGRVFCVGGVEIPATVEYVVDTRLATTLGRAGVSVSLVEHLCAALYASGIDNVRVHVEGGEIPVLDGSAAPWFTAIADAGSVEQNEDRLSLSIPYPVEVTSGRSRARLEPADALSLDVTVQFDHPAIGTQRWAGALHDATNELASARTFGFFRDRNALADIARGVSMENTVVFDDAGVMNPGGLRSRDEVVRHKALDAIGDLSLLGSPLLARFVAHRPGHALHVALLHAVRAAIRRDPHAQA